MNREAIKGIIIGVISSLIASGVFYVITKKWLWNILVPLWIWLIICLCFIAIYCLWIYIRRQLRIKNTLSEYRESCFGNSYQYVWEYKQSHGKYSALGYEPYNIRLKDEVKEALSRSNTFVYGHAVPEDSIKRIIQLTIIFMVDKKMRKVIEPTLKYLHYIEDSQKHPLLHQN